MTDNLEVPGLERVLGGLNKVRSKIATSVSVEEKSIRHAAPYFISLHADIWSRFASLPRAEQP